MEAKAYKRINYKSDFILTLNSDAGWMTPFCIKFWTGAPSQAFFVGWDGTTYTHCSYDPSEPTKLLVQFDDHHLPIGDLKFQIAYHFTVADFPNDTEDEVINPANITTEIDGQEYQVMLDFTGETAPEIEFSLPAYANEAQRIANEQQRIANEEQRIADEQTRIDNEALRISAEQTRQNNEDQRIRNEQTRISQEEARVREFATLKHESEAATTAANDAAALANQKAQLAADKAQLAADKAALAQDAANLANQKAQLAADKAALANDAAALANEKAAFAQQKAEYAKDQGDYAKQQGDYAKEQGDYAKRKGDDAAAQMQQQAQAFSEAQAARQTAYEQSEGTESGSVAGDGSRWGAFKTNEAARDAKVDAKVADITNLQEAVAEGAVYDISANNSGATYANLTAALGTDGANVPVDKRKGGMSVKFVQSSDNMYVQYRFMLSTFTTAQFTNTNNWQGVDEEPTIGSQNLVSSGGVYNSTILATKKIHKLPSSAIKQSYGYNINTGAGSTSGSYDALVFRAEEGKIYQLKGINNLSIIVLFYNGIPSANTFISAWSVNNDLIFTTPIGCSYVAVDVIKQDSYAELALLSLDSLEEKTEDEDIRLTLNTSKINIEDYVKLNWKYNRITGAADNSSTSDAVVLPCSQNMSYCLEGLEGPFHAVFFSGIPTQSSYLSSISTIPSSGIFITPSDCTFVALVLTKQSSYATVCIKSIYDTEDLFNKVSDIEDTVTDIEEITLGKRTRINEVIQTGKSASMVNGSISTSAAYNLAIIDVKPNTKYMLDGITADILVFYTTAADTAHFISSATNLQSFETPPSCAKIAIDFFHTKDYSQAFLKEIKEDISKVVHDNIDLLKGIIGTKPLTKLFFFGDSLTANHIGGVIPADVSTPATRTAMRLLTNNFPRRMYDVLSYNKPEWRRLDDNSWTKNGFTLVNNGSSQWFAGTVENYWETNIAGSYCEIKVTKNYRNFALICRTAADAGSLNVTINGSAPTNYTNPYYTSKVSENTVIDESVVPPTIPVGPSVINLLLPNSGSIGNPYHIVEFLSLPEGIDNVIRFTTADNLHNCVWGGFMWNGNTFVCMNGARGGYSINDMYDAHVVEDTILSENYDYIICELMLMNVWREVKNGHIELVKPMIERLVDDLANQNVVYTSTSTWGMSITYDSNLATSYVNPTLNEMTDVLRDVVKEKNLSFIDILKHFENLIIARGGSLDGGEGGIWYTHDGMHGNEDGCYEWFLELYRKWINLHI